MTIKLNGRIDSNNASAVEQSVLKQIEQGDKTSLVLDAAELEYISSAGLRVLLRIRKTNPAMRIVNVSPEVYEILDMTGFTEMMTVEKVQVVVAALWMLPICSSQPLLVVRYNVLALLLSTSMPRLSRRMVLLSVVSRRLSYSLLQQKRHIRYFRT